MIAVTSSKPKEILIHSLPRIGKRKCNINRFNDRSSRSVLEEVKNCVCNKYYTEIVNYVLENQASEWLNILNTAIETSRGLEKYERGPVVKFRMSFVMI